MATKFKLYTDPTLSKPVISMTPTNNIVFHSGPSEMLRIAEDGFYVRGVRLEQDDKEIEQVYNCFKEWLSWSMLNKGY
jgi:hypothetical protein